MEPKIGAALVIGGGIAGIQASLDLANAGIKVFLLENSAAIGGRMAQLDKTFPTNDCAMCTIAPRLVSIGRHKDIDVHTMSDVKALEGEPGNFKVTLNRRARFVDEHVCTGCGTCVRSCPVHFVPQPLDGQPAVELAADDQARVDHIIGEHRHRQGPLMPILQSVNVAFNYFPENVLRYVAQELRMPLAQVLRVATFYNSFSIVPRGKNIINVCMGTTCYVRGSQRLMDRFSDMLKIKPEETTPDMQFTLKSVRCIGCCGLAPAAMVGEQVFGKLTIRDVPAIIEQHQREPEHAKVDA